MAKLSELVDIRLGYTFREGIGNLPQGSVEVFQSGDLNDDIDFATRSRVAFPGNIKPHLLNEGDILISARGFPKAYIYRGKGAAAVASSSVLVLRTKQSQVLPEYIATFFNSSAGIKAYLRLSSSDSLTTITKANLGSINIPDIPLSDQQALGRLVDSIDTIRRRLDEKITCLDYVRTTAINKVLKEYV